MGLPSHFLAAFSRRSAAATSRVKAALIFLPPAAAGFSTGLATGWKIEASQEEIDSKIKEMATNYGRKEEELSKNEALKEYLANNIKTEKAIELIIKNAKIKK